MAKKNGTAVDAFHFKIEIKSLTWNYIKPCLTWSTSKSKKQQQDLIAYIVACLPAEANIKYCSTIYYRIL